MTLATSDAFVNNGGSGAVIASNGRWLIYSDAPTSDTFGNLNSNNTAIWDATYGSTPAASIAAGGDRYIFAYQPTLTVTSTGVSKTYGVDDSAALASAYSVSGLQSGVSAAFSATAPTFIAALRRLRRPARRRPRTLRTDRTRSMSLRAH